MLRITHCFLFFVCLSLCCTAQEVIPFDTVHWNINAQSYILEHYQGEDAIYLHKGRAELKDIVFQDGTIEFDVFLTERQGFPGVLFRIAEEGNMESFYLRAHLPGKPDANQAVSVFNGISGWQLYFGKAYSFAYDYHYDAWTHVKVVVNGQRAQVYLDHSEMPQLSWYLKHPARAGGIAVGGGGAAPMHYANFKIDAQQKEIVHFNVETTPVVEGIVPKWEVSDKFEETALENPAMLQEIIQNRKWEHTIEVEENSVANISRATARFGSPGNTVFARLRINSERDQVKLFEFGYSDRAVAILNGQPIYKGTNVWRSRDYRYLGTVGLFDAIYLNLKKGENTLLFAVSEDFGGWGITGRFADEAGILYR
jgi:hypothetical protein